MIEFGELLQIEIETLILSQTEAVRTRRGSSVCSNRKLLDSCNITLIALPRCCPTAQHWTGYPDALLLTSKLLSEQEMQRALRLAGQPCAVHIAVFQHSVDGRGCHLIDLLSN